MNERASLVLHLHSLDIPARAIASEVGMSPAQVCRILARARGGRWTEVERRTLVRLRSQGMGWAEIARAMGRSRESVKNQGRDLFYVEDAEHLPVVRPSPEKRAPCASAFELAARTDGKNRGWGSFLLEPNDPGWASDEEDTHETL